jgi:hypothetical protein
LNSYTDAIMHPISSATSQTEGRVPLMQIPVAKTFFKSHVNLPGTIDNGLLQLRELN